LHDAGKNTTINLDLNGTMQMYRINGKRQRHYTAVRLGDKCKESSGVKDKLTLQRRIDFPSQS